MRRLSLKSTLFGVDPQNSSNASSYKKAPCNKLATIMQTHRKGASKYRVFQKMLKRMAQLPQTLWRDTINRNAGL